MVANDDAYLLAHRGVLRFFASRLAPTVDYIPAFTNTGFS
jgi:hypothetical protein